MRSTSETQKLLPKGNRYVIHTLKHPLNVNCQIMDNNLNFGISYYMNGMHTVPDILYLNKKYNTICCRVKIYIILNSQKCVLLIN